MAVKDAGLFLTPGERHTVFEWLCLLEDNFDPETWLEGLRWYHEGYWQRKHGPSVCRVVQLQQQEQRMDIPGSKPHIDKPYAYHKPSVEGLDKITRLREAFSFVEREIRAVCPDSRQRSVALTNNEQTAMWAIKAVVFNDPASEVEG